MLKILKEYLVVPVLTDISKWSIVNAISFETIFCNSSKLSKIPDISKWDTRKVTN